MNRFFPKKEAKSLWAENGDLERLQSFFQTIESGSAENEQIKQRIKQKALQKMNGEVLESSSTLEPVRKVGWGQRARAALQGWKEDRRWKIGVPAAVGLAILLFIWQGLPGITGSLLSGRSTALEVKQVPSNQTEVPSGKAEQGTNTNGQTEEKMVALDPAVDTAAEPDTGSGNAIDVEVVAEVTPSDVVESVPAPPDAAETPPMLPANTVAIAKTEETNDLARTSETASEAESDAETETDQSAMPNAVLFAEEVPQTITNSLSLTVEVSSIPDSLAKLSGKVQQLDGYVVGARQGVGSVRSTSYLEIEIPAVKLDQLCTLLAIEGKIVDKKLQDNSPGDDQVQTVRPDSALVNIRLIGK